MILKISYFFLEKIQNYSSKINSWSWQKLWGDREKGIGYRVKRK